jgi:peptidoglycan/xylan/chitin deacetylase (PgdA/CDA1 family)
MLGFISFDLLSPTMYLAKTPDILKPIAGDLIWDIKTDSDEVFLTFDDGPHPEITPEVLDLLDEFGATATFFCIGSNVNKYPKVYQEILDRGHRTGNHTFDHPKGWNTRDYSYLRSYLLCSTLVDSMLFRPPYGRISRNQAAAIRRRSQIIMWDVLSGDFDHRTTKEKCLYNVVNYMKPGSIVVFHDSDKARERMLYSLLGTLRVIKDKGWKAVKIEDSHLRSSD